MIKKKVVPGNSIPKEKDYTNVVYKSPTTGTQASPMKTSSGAQFCGDVRNDGITGEFSGMNYPHCKDMLKVLIFLHYRQQQYMLTNLGVFTNLKCIR